MKIEKLSENQIRCTLTKRDLIDRELKISELAYGTEKAKGLFRDMMNQAFDEFGFEADDIPLIIEAIPISLDCIILIVTKVEDPEELDTRFAKFSLPSDSDADEDADDDEDLADILGIGSALSGSGDISDLLQKITAGLSGDQASSEHIIPLSAKAKEALKTSSKAQPARTLPLRCVSFPSIDAACAACAAIIDSFEGASTFYKEPNERTYYLTLRNDSEDFDFSKLLQVLSEYGTREKITYATPAYYAEHYETIIQSNAVSVLAGLA